MLKLRFYPVSVTSRCEQFLGGKAGIGEDQQLVTPRVEPSELGAQGTVRWGCEGVNPEQCQSQAWALVPLCEGRGA